MITVRECKYDEVGKFKKLEGKYHCHPETAQTILARGGDYVLQLKGDDRIVKKNADAVCRSRDPVLGPLKNRDAAVGKWTL